MHQWKLHTKVEFSKIDTTCQNWGEVYHLSTFDAELRNVSFPLISFMGFPPISSTLQPFQICIYNTKYSKLTLPNGSQLKEKSFMAILHASVESTCKSRISKIDTTCQNWGEVNHLSTFDAELRNVSFPLISFMGFPPISSTLQPFQICIYNTKYSKLTLPNGSQLMEKSFKVNLHASVDSTCKSRISKIDTTCQNWGEVNHLSTFDGELRNVSFPLISFMGFPPISSTLQPFQICIYNRKYSKLTLPNGSQLMAKRFMANLHASVESTCKSRISKIATR